MTARPGRRQTIASARRESRCSADRVLFVGGTSEFGIFTVRGVGQGGRFAPKVGFSLNGVGRTWRDRLHNF